MLLALEQGHVFVVSEAGVTNETFQQARFDNPAAMIRNRKMKLGAFFGQDIMVPVTRATRQPARSKALRCCSASARGRRGIRVSERKE